MLQSNPLSKEQFALIFWPDISPARLKMRFKINMYRIRKAVGQDTILFEDDRYRFNRSISYSWDREKLDGAFERLQQTVEIGERAELLSQAVGLMRGPYMANVDGDWVMPERVKYEELQRHTMTELAGIFLQDGKVLDCLNLAILILQSDRLYEAAHRLIIQAYANLHDPAAMTLQFRKYQQELEDELGLEPSTEISSLYAELLDAI
jgi:two-component SAPR family response regulator